MEQNCIIHAKTGPDYAPDTPPSYTTEYRSPPSTASSSSLFARGRTRRALLWGAISTVLSAIGLIGLALFEQYNGMLSELRADLKHFNETSSEFVKKDRLQKCWDRVRECSKEMSASAVGRDRLEQELKASERTREGMVKEMQRLRERLAYLEGMKAGAAINTSGASVHRLDEDQDLSVVDGQP
jgi:hypothetical protein